MKTLTPLGVALALSMSVAGPAAAQSGHGHGTGFPEAMAPSADAQSGPRSGDQGHAMRDMMQMMAQMHGNMMGADGEAMRSGERMSGMAGMDRDMMRMMMDPSSMEAAPGQDTATMMQSRLVEFDADGNGSLSLAEFEALHASMIVETTVDRFQHLDANGDGQITDAEMGAPARRMGGGAMMPGSGGMMEEVPEGDDLD